MTLRECAEKGITRVALVKDGVPVWNPYSFGDIHLYGDGTIGPWMKIYDPCGSMACGNPPWGPITVLTIEITGQPCVQATDQFEEYREPADMDRFPGCPSKPAVNSQARV